MRSMKKVMLMGMTLSWVLSAMAQESGKSYMLSTGDLYQGMSRTIPNRRVVVPYGLEVTFDKTVHLIFPASIRYGFGSNTLIAGKRAEDARRM